MTCKGDKVCVDLRMALHLNGFWNFRLLDTNLIVSSQFIRINHFKQIMQHYFVNISKLLIVTL